MLLNQNIFLVKKSQHMLLQGHRTDNIAHGQKKWSKYCRQYQSQIDIIEIVTKYISCHATGILIIHCNPLRFLIHTAIHPKLFTESLGHTYLCFQLNLVSCHKYWQKRARNNKIQQFYIKTMSMLTYYLVPFFVYFAWV